LTRKTDNLAFATRAIHAGQSPDPSTGAIMQPIYATSTYVQDSPGVHKGYEYSRSQNPTRMAYERCVADLEGGAHGYAFASGMAATATVLELVDSGAHVVAADDLYGGTRRLFSRVRERSAGLRFTYADLTRPGALTAALEPDTAMIWIESPTNPLLRLADLAEAARIGRERGILTVVDNTFATPWVQRPLELGIDVVVHSATKYLNGHSDVLAGVLVARAEDERWVAIRQDRHDAGALLGPFEAWLLLRGLRTLVPRLRLQCASALKIAEWLANRQGIAGVLYPGLPDHPGHAIAARQMRGGFGGMLSILVEGGADAALAYVAGLEAIIPATSLGGVESLIEHRATVEGGLTDVPANLLRLSVGVEHVDDLLADLERGLAAV
jgi:cystathionine beta-lyase/cystathionine gamma-synthase